MSDLNLALMPGETVGIVGESGSGKTMTLMSILGLVPPPGLVEASTIRVGDTDLRNSSPGTLRSIRGGTIGTVFQNPMGSLNPVLTVGDQISETIRAHETVTAREAKTRALSLMSRVGLENPSELYRAHPHSFSGGMAQRISIAIALAAKPGILLADEPTTALDVTVQAQIIGLLRELVDEMAMALILVSHDLGVVNQIANRTMIMYMGHVVETGPTEELLSDPRHPYTRGLLAAVPDPGRGSALPIPGRQPLPGETPAGCVFHPRCDISMEKCVDVTPTLEQLTASRCCACWATTA